MKRQVERALNVATIEIGKMVEEKPEKDPLSDTYVGIVDIASVNHQSYQRIERIVVVVK